MANGSAWHCALGREHVAVGLRPPSSPSSKHPPTSGTVPQNDEDPEGTAATKASAGAAAAAVEAVSLFATPVVVVRVPALLAAWKQSPIEDASLVELALEGYRDAHAEGTFTDEVTCAACVTIALQLRITVALAACLECKAKDDEAAKHPL